MTRWTFGEPALDETRRYADVSRRVSSLVLRMERPTPEVASLIETLEAAEAELARLVPADARPRVGDAAPDDGRLYLDHGGEIGAFNPSFPRHAITVDGDRATGRVSFPLVFEGPPGLVHGGFLAVFFDGVVQDHNCAVGETGRTTALDVGYRAPTPLDTELHFEIERRTGDGRIHSEVTLRHDDRVCATAIVRAVISERAALPAVSERRP